MLDTSSVDELHRLMKLLSHPLRLRIILMLLNRDHCVCEFFYVFKEPQNLISYNLRKLKDGGLISSYYRSNHKIYRIDDEMITVLRNHRPCRQLNPIFPIQRVGAPRSASK